MSEPVFILGGYQTDFARNWSREGRDLSDGAREAVLGALDACELDAREIKSIHVGNAMAELQRGQAHLGAMPATVVPELIGVPAMRHEAACASASIAVLAAMSEIEAGRYDCVLVLGLEEQRNLPGDAASRNMGCAGWVGHEELGGRYAWPWAFGQISAEYERRFGLKREHLHRIAELNFANARRNPRAHARSWTFSEHSFSDDDALNPLVEPHTRRNECAQVSDGACALVLASARYAEEYSTARGTPFDRLPCILGWGHASADLAFAPKLERAPPGGHLFPHVTRTVQDALRRAGLGSVEQLAGMEMHDCFAITEYLLLEHAGLAAPGEAWRLVENGALELGGRFPVNPSGGLIGGGHPIGATGARMLLDACRQVTGTAGEYQVEGAKRFGTLNIGGAMGTVCSFVVGRCAA
ncbi:MAG TPA: acetyl-CoA acetyltransferase [Solimonas sp.]|nr:acetyl-CoA acetyltransferase [Solimonas sp.]